MKKPYSPQFLKTVENSSKVELAEYNRAKRGAKHMRQSEQIHDKLTKRPLQMANFR